MKIVFSSKYNVDIGNHPWRTDKYAAVINRLQTHSCKNSIIIVESPLANDEDILRAHTMDYWHKLCNSSFTEEDERLLELPISDALIDLFWRMTGGTVLATEIALDEGLCVHLGGGFHHAFPDHGTGFCLINDIAVSVRSVIDRGMVERACIVDCDLHLGDGTAFIFRDDADVTTFSIHQFRNFPWFKQKSTIDIALEDGIGDKVYLEKLNTELNTLFNLYGPFDLLHYQAGADPYRGDSLGGLSLSIEGLQERDRMVLKHAYSHGVPVIITLGGGYPESFDDLVQIHLNTVLTALQTIES